MAIADPGATHAFVYTCGLEHEFLVRDVPVEQVPDVASLLNTLSERQVHPGHFATTCRGVKYSIVAIDDAGEREDVLEHLMRQVPDYDAPILELALVA